MTSASDGDAMSYGLVSMEKRLSANGVYYNYEQGLVY